MKAAARAILLACCVTLPPGWRTCVAAADESAPQGNLSIEYRQRRLSADIRGVALATVLETLRQKTGTDFRIQNATMRELPIWTRFDSLTLSAGIRELLDDVPYVHYADAGGSTIFVLFSASTAEHFARFGAPQPAVIREDGAEFAAVSQSIEQLQNPAPSSAQVMAVNQLASVRSERAIDALVEAASSNESDELRVEATSALAQAALATPDQDTKALRVLQQLASEHNQYVRDIARAALRSIEQGKAEAAIAASQ